MTNGPDPPDLFENTSPDPVVRGGTLTITVSGGPPNSTVKVTISDGEGFSEEKEIVTDGQGNGAIEWPVNGPEGPSLFLDAEGSQTHTVNVIDAP